MRMFIYLFTYLSIYYFIQGFFFFFWLNFLLVCTFSYVFIIIMFNILRRVVAGPKNRTVQNQYDLDLTYITDRIIAMAFPATGIEKTYRNSIQDVVKFLNQRHGEHYLIINSSNRSYDYQYFNYQVLQFFWADHQAPPLTMLFELANKIQVFFNDNPQNVVAVHCNHGKGRTGTAIISYLLFNKQFSTVKQALKFYNAKRFSDLKYAVDQPCQLRYLNFFQAIQEMSIDQIDKELIAFKLSKVAIKGFQQDRELKLRITQTRTQHIIYQDVALSSKVKKVSNNRPLINDIFIQVVEQSWKGQKQLVRINFNLFFLQKSKNQQQQAQKQKTKTYGVIFKSEQIKVNSSQKKFQLILQFQQFCKCHKHNHKHKHQQESSCLCSVKRIRQQTFWDSMIEIIKKNRKRLQIETQQKQIIQSFSCLKKETQTQDYLKQDQRTKCMQKQKYNKKSIENHPLDKIIENNLSQNKQLSQNNEPFQKIDQVYLKFQNSQSSDDQRQYEDLSQCQIQKSKKQPISVQIQLKELQQLQKQEQEQKQNKEDVIVQNHQNKKNLPFQMK